MLSSVLGDKLMKVSSMVNVRVLSVLSDDGKCSAADCLSPVSTNTKPA